MSYAFDVDNSSDSDEFDFGQTNSAFFSQTTKPAQELASNRANLNNNHTANQNAGSNGYSPRGRGRRPGRWRGRGRGVMAQIDRPRHDPATLESFRNAVCRGDVVEVRHLLENGVDPNARLKSSWTALMFAADSGRTEVVQILLSHSANPNSQCDMFTALMVCCASRQREDTTFQIAELLLGSHANVNAQDRFKMTPFLYATKLFHLTLLPLLSRSGASVNKQEMRGWSALCFAAHSGDEDLARVLLECGSDVSLETKEGEVAADLADTGGHYEVARMLRSHSSQEEAPVPEPEPEPEPELREVCESAVPIRPQIIRSEDTALSTRTANNYVRYGDMELFLMGVDLPDLIPLFQSQSLGFSDLISMRGEDLERLGVTDLGARTKLQGAIKEVHSQEWDCPPVPSHYNKNITSLELAGILRNFSRHCDYIKGQLLFIERQLDTAPDTIEPHTECEETRLVCEGVRTAVESSDQLIRTLQAVQRHVTQRTGFAVKKPVSPRGTYLGTFLRAGLVAMAGFLVGGSVVFIVSKGTNKL